MNHAIQSVCGPEAHFPITTNRQLPVAAEAPIWAAAFVYKSPSLANDGRIRRRAIVFDKPDGVVTERQVLICKRGSGIAFDDKQRIGEKIQFLVTGFHGRKDDVRFDAFGSVQPKADFLSVV